MKISRWNSKKDGKGTYVTVSPEDAHRIIQSLSGQIATRSPNTVREEFRTEDGEYFSIAVHPPRRGQTMFANYVEELLRLTGLSKTTRRKLDKAKNRKELESMDVALCLKESLKSFKEQYLWSGRDDTNGM